MKNIGPTRIALSIGVATLLVWTLGCGASGLQPEPSGTLSFVSSSSPTLTAPAASIAIGDFNQDGKLDLAVAADGGVLNLLPGRGDGSFTPGPTVPLAFWEVNNALAADFRGDGNLDLAFSLPSAYEVQTLMGSGADTFTAMAPIPISGDVWQVASGDFNRDGRADLVVYGLGLQILLSNSDGTFSVGPTIAVAGFPASVAVADFNGDGIPDLAVACQPLGSTQVPGWIEILLGNGDGTFTAIAQTPSTGYVPSSLAVGDFNGDGIPDLAIANPYYSPYSDQGSVTILLGRGDGTFAPMGGSLVTGSLPTSIAVADFNGDGKADLVTANSGVDTVTVFLGNGNGTFAAPMSISVGARTCCLAVGDFNGDGLSDIPVGIDANSVTILLAHLTPLPQAAPNIIHR